MRFSFYSIFIAAALFVVSCNSSHNHAEHSHDAHGHFEGDGHNHEKDEHGHLKTAHAHSADEHAHETAAHDHVDGDHSNEIVFTAKQAEAAGMKTETVMPSAFYNVIKTSGRIQAPEGDELTVVATSAGTVSYANASIADGTPVRNGETIVTISAKNLQEGDPALKAKLAFETAEKEYLRAKTLIADRIISEKEFEQVRLSYETAKEAYQGQSANITAGGVRVTSPLTGYVKNRLVAQGDYVTVGQPIATVAQNRRLQLKADVSERYFNQLKNITGANFKTSYDDTVYELSKMNGRLLSYGKASDNSSFYIPVTFEFDNVGDIIPGSFAEVYLLASQRNDVISVPLTALTEEQGLHFVYIQIEPEIFVKREVVLGQKNGERAEVVAGLHGGEKVVTNGVIQVKLASVSGAIPHGHNH